MTPVSMKVLWLAVHALLACQGFRSSPRQEELATLHVNRSVAQASHPELCASSIVRSQCDVLGTSLGQASATTLQALFSASDESIKDLWLQLFGGSSVLLAVGCQQLCDTVVSFLRSREQLPPASDTSCYDDGKELRCLDLNVPAMESQLGLSGKQFPDVGDKEVLEEDALSQAKVVDVSLEDLQSNGSQPGAASEVYNSTRTHTVAQLEYSVPDLAVKVARHFHVFPAQEATFELVGGESSLLQHAALTSAGTDVGSGLTKLSRKVRIEVNENLQQARAYVTNAISEFSRVEAEHHIAAWFGPADRTVRQEILRVLNSIDFVLSKAGFVYPGSECHRPGVVAYVVPRGDSTDPLARARTSDGSHVFYLCDRFFSGKGEQVLTLLHEASHHAVGFTDDVCIDDLCGGDLACYQFLPRGKLPADVAVGELLSTAREPRRRLSVEFIDDDVVKVQVDPPLGKCRNEAYGVLSCRTLAQVVPGKALRNADNVGYYITSVNGQRWGSWGPQMTMPATKQICKEPFPGIGDQIRSEGIDQGSCEQLIKKTEGCFAGLWACGRGLLRR